MIKNENKLSLYLALGALIGLLAGFGLGVWTNRTHSETLWAIVPWTELFGKLWLCTLITLAIPLVGAYFYNVVVTMVRERIAGMLGFHALLFHLFIMVLGIGFTLTLSSALTGYITGGFTMLLNDTSTESVTTNASYFITSVDAYQTFVSGLMLPLLIILVLVALVSSRFFHSHNSSVLRYAKRISEQSTRLTKIVMLLMPISAFSLAFAMASRSGYTLVGIMGGYVFALISLLLGFIVVLYILAALFGRVHIGKFIRSLFPAQLVAASTRSSMATMPTLIDSAQRIAGIPPSVTGLVIPFSISIFRLNRAISSTFSYVFLTTLYNIPTDFGTTALFLLMIVLLSFGSPGVPSGGKLATMPVYLAMGVPLEMLILLKAIDVIPDIFKTVLNVTEVMTIASLVTRSNALALKFQ